MVGDIDDIVKKVHFPDWQHTTQGERLVQEKLRRTFLKHKLHTDQDLFDRAYAYIKQYYGCDFGETPLQRAPRLSGKWGRAGARSSHAARFCGASVNQSDRTGRCCDPRNRADFLDCSLIQARRFEKP